MQTAQHVYYNGGPGKENQYALVERRHDDGKLDLIVLTESGNQAVKSVPQREPHDYGPEGGGVTWHLSPNA